MDNFLHPGEKRFEECDRTFTTSRFADGKMLGYSDEIGSKQFIYGNEAQEKLYAICSICPKYKDCKINEILVNVLNFVR